MRWNRTWCVAVAGIAVGMACKDQIERAADSASGALIDSGHAAEADDCTQWQYERRTDDETNGSTGDWEPFAYTPCGTGWCVVVRRCAG